MRQSYCTITPAIVRGTAQGVLQQALPWKPYGRLVSVARLLGLLLLVAALRSSLSAVARRHRYTVGLVALEKGFKPHQVVEALLTQLDEQGLRLRGCVLDSGFDSGATLLLLRQRDLAYTVPLQRKGKGDNRRNACFALPA